MRLTAKELAAKRGVSDRAIRMQIAKGKLRGFRAPDPITEMEVWWVELPEEDPEVAEAVLEESEVNPETSGSLPEVIGRALELIERLHCENGEYVQQITRLNDERAELYGRLGFLQSENLQLKNQLEGTHAQLQLTQARLLELEAPKGAVAETTNHLTDSENGADSGSERSPRRPWWRFWS